MEEQLKAFVDSVVNYFDVMPQDGVNVGTPYLINSDHTDKGDYLSGVIGISGQKTGWLRYCAPRIMVKHLLLSMGEQDTSNENVQDMLGEVANTISGNLRRHFGSEFLISVPKVIEGTEPAMNSDFENRCYVIPIYWKQYNSSVVIYLS